MNFFQAICAASLPIEFFDQASSERMQKSFSCLRENVAAGEYIGGAFSISAVISITTLIASLKFFPLSSSLAASLLLFSLLFFSTIRLPVYLSFKRAEETETEMPLWLRIIGVELECGFPLEKALESACDGEGGFSKDLREALSEVDRGKSFPQAMKSLSEKSESKFFKRFCQQLALFSEEGKGSESISKLAEEVSENQKNKARVHSAQLSFLSLFFMAIGCILPSLLAAYVIAGSAFLETHFSTEFVFLAFVVAFPLADSAILLYLREKTPKMVSG